MWQISEALRRYGLNQDTKSVLVVRVSHPGEALHDKIAAVVTGTVVPLHCLNALTDWTAVKKVRALLQIVAPVVIPRLQYHKLNGEPCIRNAAGHPEIEHAKINDIVISTVATKIVLS